MTSPRSTLLSLVVTASVTGFFPGRSSTAADASKLPPPSTQAGVTFEKDILPIFVENCLSCHGPKKQKGEIRLDTLAATLKGGEHGRILTPGDSSKGDLVLSVARVNERDAMPPIRKAKAGAPPETSPARALTPAEVGLIRAWIDQGAH